MFCKSVDAKVILERTCIFYSINANRQICQDITSRSGFQCTDDIGKYLGVSILHNGANKQTFGFIMDKFNRWLNNWKSSMLSMVG